MKFVEGSIAYVKETSYGEYPSGKEIQSLRSRLPEIHGVQAITFDGDRNAYFSRCRTWRYALWRIWKPNTGAGYCAFVGLNPSTADETQDDPTVRRCINFAKAWGYDGLIMLNMFAFRATDPRVMLKAGDPVGPENNGVLKQVTRFAGRTVVAWGVHGTLLDRHLAMSALLPADVYCLGTTQAGHPKHPLYISGQTEPQIYQFNKS